MAPLKLNPDGSPTKALDDLRKRKIRERPDRGQITPHFNLNEFHTKDARGSAVPVNAWPAVIRLCEEFLEPMRAKFGTCIVLSGYRHRLYNDQIGGVRNSQHIYDETPGSVAADTRYAQGSPQQWVAHAKRLRTQAGSKGGIGRYDRSGFVHIDNRGFSADWQGN